MLRFLLKERNPDMSAPQLTPDQAKFLLAVALPTIKKEQAVTKQVIEAIPLDKGDYRPDNIAKSALDLAWHVVAAEKRFLAGIAAGEFDFTPLNRPETIRNSADIAAWYDEAFKTNIARLEQMSGEQLAKLVDFRGMFNLPAVAYLTFSQNHSIHHTFVRWAPRFLRSMVKAMTPARPRQRPKPARTPFPSAKGKPILVIRWVFR
jgi:uncharacterized damage-inducible protein DinB